MFTGLVQEIGTVERVSQSSMTDLWLSSTFTELQLGESIACDGCCLTVVEAKGSEFKVQASPETLRRTTLGEWKGGTRVNLERALRLGDRLGGHWVQGHVDGVSKIVSATEEGGSRVLAFELPENLAAFFIEKGSVTVDGISLTVNEVRPGEFSVALIPETLTRTTLGGKGAGARVNLEADLVGKYVARQQQLSHQHEDPSRGAT